MGLRCITDHYNINLRNYLSPINPCVCSKKNRLHLIWQLKTNADLTRYLVLSLLLTPSIFRRVKRKKKNMGFVSCTIFVFNVKCFLFFLQKLVSCVRRRPDVNVKVNAHCNVKKKTPTWYFKPLHQMGMLFYSEGWLFPINWSWTDFSQMVNNTQWTKKKHTYIPGLIMPKQTNWLHWVCSALIKTDALQLEHLFASLNY